MKGESEIIKNLFNHFRKNFNQNYASVIQVITQNPRAHVTIHSYISYGLQVY